MKSLALIFIVIQFMILGCDEKPQFVNYKNENIQYNGRVDFSAEDKALLTWAGSSVKIRFKGDGVKVLLQNRHSPSSLNVVIDDDNLFVIESDSTKQWFTLASNLPYGEHNVKVFKRINDGDLWFYGFQLDDGAELLKLEKRKRVIEYLGDSITHGSSINDTTGGVKWQGLFSDNYFTYAAVTARNFNAEYYCIAQGGVGLMVGGNVNTIDDLYYRMNIRDDKKKWDFSKVQPEIVVINLFQNDFYIITENPNHAHFIKKFGTKKPTEEYIINAYIDLVKEVKGHYPKAKVICALGSMTAAKTGSPWPGYIEKAVNEINSSDVYYLLFPYKNTPGHPNVNEHKIMADTLISFIKRNNLWGE